MHSLPPAESRHSVSALAGVYSSQNPKTHHRRSLSHGRDIGSAHATFASHEGQICKPKMSQFDAIQGGYCMRRDVQPHGEDADSAGYTFNFQISSSRGRQACSVKVQAQNFQDATQFIRQNWPIIETMAREELAKGCRHIELAAP